MRRVLKAGAGRLAEAAGLLRRRHKGRLVVLTFHRVRPGGEEPDVRAMRTLDVEAGDFRRLLGWMAERYTPVALNEWAQGGRATEHPCFAVTFDDGWADNYQHAYPILRELGIPATIFLATGAVEDRQPFWWQHPGLTDAEIERMKLAGTPWKAPDAGPEQRRWHEDDFLRWEQIREMGQDGLVTFGAHGHGHALLDALPREEALADIRRCWDVLHERIPEWTVPLLAWPNGNARDDLDEELFALGLRAAFGTKRGTVSVPAAGGWNLPRNNVDLRLSQDPGLWPWLLLRAN